MRHHHRHHHRRHHRRSSSTARYSGSIVWGKCRSPQHFSICFKKLVACRSATLGCFHCKCRVFYWSCCHHHLRHHHHHRRRRHHCRHRGRLRPRRRMRSKHQQLRATLSEKRTRGGGGIDYEEESLGTPARIIRHRRRYRRHGVLLPVVDS